MVVYNNHTNEPAKSREESIRSIGASILVIQFQFKSVKKKKKDIIVERGVPSRMP